MDLKKEIGMRLKELSSAMKMDNKEFASILQTNVSTLYKIYRGDVRIQDYSEYILAKEHNVNLSWLKAGKGPMFYPDAFEILGYGLDIINETWHEIMPVWTEGKIPEGWKDPNPELTRKVNEYLNLRKKLKSEE